MWRDLLRMLPIFGASAFACMMAILFSITATEFPAEARHLGPTVVTLAVVSFLGVAVVGVIAAQGRRIQELERRLRDPESRGDGPA